MRKIGGGRFVFLRFKTNYLKANVCMCVCVFIPFVWGKDLRQIERVEIGRGRGRGMEIGMEVGR